MRILVVSGGYPSPGRPEFPFVEQLCNEWALQGHDITVIVPHSRTKRIVRKLRKVEYRRVTFSDKGSVTVFSPEYWSLGNYGENGINQKLFADAVNRTAKHLAKPDFVYGHFWHNGRGAFDIAKSWNVPLVIASGEAEIEQTVKTAKDKEFIDYVNSVVCVSTKNKDESIIKGLTTADKCEVFPNAVDNKLFFQRDKQIVRRTLGYNKEDFIVCFVGGFIPRKGPNRVSDAIKLIDNPNIKSIFIGGNRDGSFTPPDCDGILFQGKLPHESIPEYMSASDVFVLPTLHEGCCNAIVEAMACGLPIISSDLPFNWDILNERNSILINPMNINEIASAINAINCNNEMQAAMSKASLIIASELTISQRAKRIIDFIKRKNHL